MRLLLFLTLLLLLLWFLLPGWRRSVRGKSLFWKIGGAILVLFWVLLLFRLR